MRRATKIVAATGVSLAVILGLWLLIAPGQLVKHPFDHATAVARGAPHSLRLEIRRIDKAHVHARDNSTEAGAWYELKPSGDAAERNGLTLIPMTGSLSNAPADPAYIDREGIARTLTTPRLVAQLEALGVDLRGLDTRMTPAQRRLMELALAQAVPLDYFVSVKTRLLVEPRTGAIVSLDSLDQTLTVAPDPAGFARVADLLAQPPLTRIPAVQKAAKAIGALAEPRPAKVYTLHYAQTPQSVADFAAHAQDEVATLDLVEHTIPLALALLTALALGATGVMTARERLRTGA